MILELLLVASLIKECPDGYLHQPPFCVSEVQIAEPIEVVGWWGSGTERWRPWLEIYFHPWEIERALAVMRCESLGDPYAVNPSSGASGLFQHMPEYWEERSTRFAWGGYGIMEVDANIAVAASLVHHEGWHHWRACL